MPDLDEEELQILEAYEAGTTEHVQDSKGLLSRHVEYVDRAELTTQCYAKSIRTIFDAK